MQHMPALMLRAARGLHEVRRGQYRVGAAPVGLVFTQSVSFYICLHLARSQNRHSVFISWMCSDRHTLDF